MTGWLLATAAYDVWLAQTGRLTLSQEMRKHPALTITAAAILAVHLYAQRKPRCAT